MLLVVILVTIFVAAAGGLWFIKLQREKAAVEAKASSLFKPKVGGGGAGAMNLEAVRAMQRDEWDDDDEVDVEDDQQLAVQRRGAPRGADDQEDEARDGRGGDHQTLANMTRLERRKHDKMAEKEMRRQGVAAEIAEQRKKKLEADQRDAEAAEAEKRRAAEEDAALRALREERKRQDDEGYRQWIGQIAMEGKGELGEEGQHEKALRTFLLHEAPKLAKVHVLEEIASAHSLSVEKVVSIMEGCIKNKEMSGVFDDRGKFIFVTDAEYDAVARFLRQRGRVSMSELIRETNRVITANEEAKEKQKEECGERRGLT